MYSVVNDTISDLDCDAEKAVTFFGSAGFIAPLIIFLLWVKITIPITNYNIIMLLLL